MPEKPTTRVRSYKDFTLARRYATQTTRHGVTSVLTDEPARVFPGTQVTVSEGHPWPPPKGSPQDVGGDFFTEKKYVLNNSGNAKVVDISFEYVLIPGIKGTTYRYVGPVTALNLFPVGGLIYPPSGRSSNEELDAYGAIAIDRCKPTNSVADVSIALGELLKDGLPFLIGSSAWLARTLNFRMLGDEYLNLQFGWKPFVQDIRKFANALVQADQILAQYERDSGKVVRRKYDFPLQEEVTETTKVSDPPWGPTPPQHMYVTSSGNSVRRRETRQRRWFSGAFTYHLPSGHDSRSELAKAALGAKKLLGLTLTPETLWNLAPWSWAIDWFSSTGSVVSNLTDASTDGLVMRYGYIMEHTIVKDTYTNLGSVLRGKSPQVPSITLVTETKVRREANPFGFGLIWEDLSPFQVSILAALGITRKR